MVKLVNGLMIKEYWVLFFQCSLRPLKKCFTTVRTRIQADNYLAVQVKQVRAAMSTGVGESYHQLEVGKCDI